MKKVFSAEHLPGAGHIQNLLQANGIACMLRNENLSGCLGGIPPLECEPEVWITNDEEYERARQLIEEFAKEPDCPGDPWLCPACKELIEAQFSHCWQCGSAHPD